MIDVTLQEIRAKMASFLGKEIPIDKQMLILEDALNKKWHENEQDTTAYENEIYLYVAYLCFKKYSRGFVKRSVPVINKFGCKTILDAGAGIGGTSLLLARLMPDVEIIYHNLPGQQFEFARYIMSDVANVRYASSSLPEGKVDAIMALELFEHIKNPIEMLTALHSLAPRLFIISNSFSPRAFGHYSEYVDRDRRIYCSRMGRIFNAKMRELGYEKISEYAHPVFWNSRPAVWTNSHV